MSADTKPMLEMLYSRLAQSPAIRALPPEASPGQTWAAATASSPRAPPFPSAITRRRSPSSERFRSRSRRPKAKAVSPPRESFFAQARPAPCHASIQMQRHRWRVVPWCAKTRGGHDASSLPPLRPLPCPSGGDPTLQVQSSKFLFLFFLFFFFGGGVRDVGPLVGAAAHAAPARFPADPRSRLLHIPRATTSLLSVRTTPPRRGRTLVETGRALRGRPPPRSSSPLLGGGPTESSRAQGTANADAKVAPSSPFFLAGAMTGANGGSRVPQIALPERAFRSPNITLRKGGCSGPASAAEIVAGPAWTAANPPPTEPQRRLLHACLRRAGAARLETYVPASRPRPWRFD